VPDQIRKAVTILRPYLAGTEWRGRLDRLIGAYATGHLFSVERASRGLFRTTKRHREHGKKLLAAITDELVKRDLPEAWQAGAKSAEPILRGMVGRTGKLETLADVGRAMQLTGAVAKNARRDLAAIRHAFAAELKASGKMLSGEVEAAFAAGMRGHQTRRQLADDLLASEQAARKQLSKAYREVRSTGQALQQAERTGTDAEIKEARKAYQAANRKPGQVKTLLARFETRVQGHARDAIRQAAQASQTARFREMKFKVATWTAVNGSGSCPSCDHLHGTTKPFDDWWGNGPGDGGTLCGASCMCILVPEEYAATRQGLDKPVRMDGGGGRKPAEPKPELEPIKLGGKLAGQAKEVAKRSAAKAAVTSVDLPRLPAAERASLRAGADGVLRGVKDAAGGKPQIKIRIYKSPPGDEQYAMMRGGIGGIQVGDIGDLRKPWDVAGYRGHRARSIKALRGEIRQLSDHAAGLSGKPLKAAKAVIGERRSTLDQYRYGPSVYTHQRAADRIAAAAAHEAGHVIENHGLVNWPELVHKHAVTDNDLLKVSVYASSHSGEAFAEAVAARFAGLPLPARVAAALDEAMALVR